MIDKGGGFPDGLMFPGQAERFVASMLKEPGFLLPVRHECWPKKAQRWWERLKCWVRGHDLGEPYVARTQEWSNGMVYAYDRRVCARCEYWREDARELWPMEIEQKVKELAESIHLADIGAQLGEAPEEALRELATFILTRR